MRKVGRMKGMPTKLSAVGILMSTLIAIGNGGWAPVWVREVDGQSCSLQVNSALCYGALRAGGGPPTTLLVLMLLLPVIIVIMVITDDNTSLR